MSYRCEYDVKRKKGAEVLPSIPPHPIPWLESLYFTTLRLGFRCGTHCVLSGFLGHDIRSGIGKHLKAYMNCRMDRDQCLACSVSLRTTCLYDRLCAHGVNPPKPFVLRLETKLRQIRTVWRKGDMLWVDVTLIGNAFDLVNHLVDAVRQRPLKLGKDGVEFDLVSEACVHSDDSTKPFSYDPKPPRRRIATTLDKAYPTQQECDLELICLTPTEIRVPRSSDFVRDPQALTLKIVLSRMMGRTHDLAKHYCDWTGNKDTELQQSVRASIDMAGASLLKSNTARWQSARAWNKPDRERGGLVETLVFKDVPYCSSVIGLLNAAESLGLGKGCTNGFGQVTYRYRFSDKEIAPE